MTLAVFLTQVMLQLVLIRILPRTKRTLIQLWQVMSGGHVTLKVLRSCYTLAANWADVRELLPVDRFDVHLHIGRGRNSFAAIDALQSFTRKRMLRHQVHSLLQ